MEAKFVAPKFKKVAFSCPHCNVCSRHEWHGWGSMPSFVGGIDRDVFHWAVCANCSMVSIWVSKEMVYPSVSSIPSYHADMPEDCVEIYREAQAVYPHSPKAALALLRLLVEKLVYAIGAKPGNLNKAIAQLVADGLPEKVQKALDVCRVIGNEAVHPGTIVLDDDEEVTRSLFGLVNFIVEKMISEPNKISELYDGLPEGKIEGISQRDKK